MKKVKKWKLFVLFQTKRRKVIENCMPCNVMDVNNDVHGFETNSFTENAYQVAENQSIPIYANVQTYPCSSCGRCFNAESLVDQKNNLINHS